jgi:Tol biopolymer transport system component
MKLTFCLIILSIILAIMSLVSCIRLNDHTVGLVNRIAFVVSEKNTPGSYIVTIKYDGSGLIKLSRYIGLSSHNNNIWSKNGKMVYIEGDFTNQLIWLSIINGDNTEQRRLLNVDNLDLDSMCISNDGKKALISYMTTRIIEGSFEGSTHKKEVRGSAFDEIDTMTGEVKRLIDLDNIYVGNAAYSLDGSQIAFYGFTIEPHTNLDIFVMNADGNNLRRLTHNQYDINHFETPQWSPDGSKILYGLETQNIDGITQYDDLFVVDIGTGNTKNLTDSLYVNDAEARWSPDGKQIAFTSGNESMPSAMYIMDADGSNMRKISSSISQPSWSPSGRYIVGLERVYDKTTSQLRVSGIMKMDLKTGNTMMIFQTRKEYMTMDYPIWLGN